MSKIILSPLSIGVNIKRNEYAPRDGRGVRGNILWYVANNYNRNNGMNITSIHVIRIISDSFIPLPQIRFFFLFFFSL